MTTKLIIIDHDGTLTDIDREGQELLDLMLEQVARLTGAPFDSLQQRAEELLKEMQADPSKAALTARDTHDDIVVVGSAASHLGLLAKPVTIEMLRCQVSDQLFVDRLIEMIYHQCYPELPAHYRDGARVFLEECAEMAPTYVVSSSDRDRVAAKLFLGITRLPMAFSDPAKYSGAFWRDRVIGNARKHVIDPDFDLVAETLEVPGLNRPVLLRRRHYNEILLDLMGRHDVDHWSDVTVIGDIFEFDLALPFVLGARVGLVVTEFTPEYELDFMGAQNPNRARLLHSVADMINFARE